MDAGKISGHVRADQAAGEGGTLGGHRRYVGRTRPEYAGRRIAGASDSGRQEIFSEELWRRYQDRLESGFVWIQLAASPNLQEIRHRLFRDQQAAMGHGLHKVPIPAVLVGSARWESSADIFSARIRQ